MFATFGIPKAPFVTYEECGRRIHPDDLPRVEASIERTIRDKKQDFFEFRIIRPDGEMRHISGAMGVILDEHGTVVRIVGTCVDITERKRMEAEIEAKKEQLVSSARLSALGMMAGGIAHEINNPLGVIQASAENILRMTESGSAQIPAMLKNCDQIIVTADRISRIVRSLRHIAREGGADEFRETPVREIVEETLELCSERFRAHNIRLDVPAVDPQAVITCREVQICQVLLNLLQNAFDELVNQEGDRWVKLDVTCRPPWVAISVGDSGQGIAPENRSHITEPFFTTKPVGKGTGLGLSISRSIVLEHGGTLELDQSSPHTCFVMKLPLSGGT
jgi:C4-dicarboxylate-specific signal transduction histidine kinase